MVDGIWDMGAVIVNADQPVIDKRPYRTKSFYIILDYLSQYSEFVNKNGGHAVITFTEEIKTTKIYTHVLNRGVGVRSPLD